MSNEYSALWFSTFLATVPEERTRAELAFLRRQLPQDQFRRILDIACGPGRHAHALGEFGYTVTGVDVDTSVLAVARERPAANVAFLEADMRDLARIGQTCDAAICIWQSFGYFDTATNRRVLRAIHSCLEIGGRFILDIYNRRFFELRSGRRRFQRNGMEVTEETELRGGRLFVQLQYGDTSAAERFDWEVFTLGEITAVAYQTGLEPVLSCREFDESRGVSDENPRMQLVFDRLS